MRSSATQILVEPHEQLTAHRIDQLRALFDNEYLTTHGEWDPEQPYGYAPHDVHLIATAMGAVVGHVGWAKRVITVNGQEVTIAGVGGVLVSPAGRGHHLGQQLMEAARQSMLADPDIEFGFLGCAESVVPFYASSGWQRIRAPERWISRGGRAIASPAGHPLFILPVHGNAAEWPTGEVDLKGRSW
ncbi:GNAT family N-acetyltransferase [Kocuria sp. ICS0012]|uniref:GNAT family N-acetyltransferase n=1 Tax=Kocuria sp. ICS0012 TaxID=1834155 RepID=UPI0007EAF9A7|nr:GNAT family N-acetyltransferase [Kocuria sp. ICS0012]OBA50208.1 GNAT family acetyltransferase [Kocuria sp. ICS0012]